MLNICSCPYLSSVHSLWWNISIPFPHFLIGLFVFSLLNFESSLCILDSSLLLDLWFIIIFSQSVSCFFHPFNRVFYRTEVFCCFSFFLVLCLFLFWCGLIYQSLLLWNMFDISLRTFCLSIDTESLCLFILSFKILLLMFKSVVHSELIFM